jgi:hypothetical protein
MAIKGIDDIEREKRIEERFKIKKEAIEDINDVISGVFRKPKKKKTFIDYIFFILKFLGVIILIMVVVNLILGNIWLLRFFMKSLFGVG